MITQQQKENLAKGRTPEARAKQGISLKIWASKPENHLKRILPEREIVQRVTIFIGEDNH